jgi:hypothetical protein
MWFYSTSPFVIERLGKYFQIIRKWEIMVEYQSFTKKRHLFIIGSSWLISLKSLRKPSVKKRLYFGGVDSFNLILTVILDRYKLLKIKHKLRINFPNSGLTEIG